MDPYESEVVSAWVEFIFPKQIFRSKEQGIVEVGSWDMVSSYQNVSGRGIDIRNVQRLINERDEIQ